MTPYFADERSCLRLRVALHRRKGLPFRYGIGDINAGYDCWHLLMDVYEEAGVNVSAMKEKPKGSLNWGRAQPHSKMLEFFHGDAACRRHLKRIDEDEDVNCGDLLLIRQAMSANHLAIAECHERAWHVPRSGSVSQVSIKALREAGFLHAIFRLHV